MYLLYSEYFLKFYFLFHFVSALLICLDLCFVYLAYFAIRERAPEVG